MHPYTFTTTVQLGRMNVHRSGKLVSGSAYLNVSESCPVQVTVDSFSMKLNPHCSVLVSSRDRFECDLLRSIDLHF